MPIILILKIALGAIGARLYILVPRTTQIPGAKLKKHLQLENYNLCA